MTSLVSESFQAAFSDREPWPDDVYLYQHEEAAQILLPDFAACLSVKTFLRMCHLKYTVVIRCNADNMSPSGKIPFIQAGRNIVSEMEPIIEFVKSKGYQLSEHLTDEERLLMKSFMALVNKKFLLAELYMTWNEKTMYKRVTEQRYGQPYPWPLNKLLPLRKRWNMQCMLKYNGWNYKSKDEVCNEVRRCCKALSEKLGEQVFFFGDKPTELDALVYGHLYSLLATFLPFVDFADIVKEFDNLIQFVKRTDSHYYGKYVQ